jgi:hypothetical protein
MADAVVHLRATGEVVPDEWLTHTSPRSVGSTSVRRVIFSEIGLPLCLFGRRSLNLVRRRDAA